MAIAGHGVVSYMGANETTFGLLQSFNVSLGGDASEAKDKDGNVKDIEYFNSTIEVTMTVILESTASIPARGDVIAVTHRNTAWSGNYIVESVSLNESNTDRPELTITAKRYLNNSIPPANP